MFFVTIFNMYGAILLLYFDVLRALLEPVILQDLAKNAAPFLPLT